MIKITKHAQSCLLIKSQNNRILIDPGKYSKIAEDLSVSDIKKVDLLIISHEHPDHFEEEMVREIIERDKPMIVSTKNVKETLSDYKDLFFEDSILSITDGEIEFLPQFHRIVEDESEVCEVKGSLITIEGTSIYHPGDTIKLKRTADIILVPICGTVVLNIEQAKEQLLELKPRLAIPVHYDTPNYPVDVNDFVSTMAGTGIKVRVLENGESLEI